MQTVAKHTAISLLACLTLVAKPCWLLRESKQKMSPNLGPPGSEVGGWTQQYGDQSSTSYTEYIDNGQFRPGWNYTTENFVSQTSPCVNEFGVLYYPLRANVIAIAPNGSTIWECGVSPNGNSYLTNTLYSKSHDYVIVGSTWVQQNTFFQFVAINAMDGAVVWTKVLNELYHPTTISLSIETDCIFVAGYDKSSFAAVKITNGEILWEKKNIYQVGIFMQLKVGNVIQPLTDATEILEKQTLNSSTKQFSSAPKQILSLSQTDAALNGEVVLLPTDPWDGFEGKGRLYAYDTAEGLLPVPHLHWYTDLGFTAGAMFAFSSVGILYGSNSGSEGSKGALFLVNLTTGHLVYNDDGWCDRGAGGLSGPVVDQQGCVYFSCGNQMFSLTPNGFLRWQSAKFGNSSLGSVTPPSIHPDGYTYFIHQNGTVVYRLMTRDGSLDKTYSVPKLGYFEPPILVGSMFMYLIGFEGSAVSIVPIEL